MEHSQQPCILITGASSGIGLEVARQSLQRGWRVVAWSRTASQSVLADAAAPELMTIVDVDVVSKEQVQGAWNDMLLQQGCPDIVFHNAGVGAFAAINELTEAEFERMIDVNLRAPWFLSRLAMPSMVARKSGIVAHMNSVASTDVFPGCTGYSASKMGLLGVSRSLRAEVRADGVKVIDFFVGATKSNIWSADMLAERGAEMMEASSVAESIVETLAFCLQQPNAMLEEVHIKPQGGNL